MERKEYDIATGESKVVQLTQEEIDALPVVVVNPLEECYRLRLEAYGSIGSQLDLMYHEGYDGWKAFIQQVKLTIPKP